MPKGQKNHKKYRKKRRLRLLYRLISFVLIVAVAITGCVLFFKVDTIEVVGNIKYSGEQIVAVAAVEENTNLLLLPTREISGRITAALPYVDTVRIKRVFPTTLQIVVEECVPMASIQTDGVWWILDARGKVLEQAQESIASACIQVAGLTLTEPQVGEKARVADEDIKRLKGLCGLLTALKAKGIAENVRWIDVSAETEIEVGYLGRFTVRLSLSTDYGNQGNDNEEYNRKIEALKKMVDLLNETDPVSQGTIDLRFENGYFQPTY